MIAATYDCGCKPTKTTHGHPNCFESRALEGHGPRYTLLKCQTTAPPLSCPNTDCCKPVRCGVPPSCEPVIPSCGTAMPTCGSVIPGCGNFGTMYKCNCSHEPPELPELPDSCTCGLKKVESCKLDAEGRCDPCSTPKPERVVSDIAKKGLPYKEIEAIINNNRMVIRLQKEEIEEEFEPPCDCPDGPGTGANVAATTSQSELEAAKRQGDEIVYEMSDFATPGFSAPAGQSSMVRQSCDQEGKGGRTITMYPHPGNRDKLTEQHVESQRVERRDKRALHEKTKTIRPIDLEENPNIFVLRIRKISNNSEGKQKLDFEFRAPRPWLKRKEPIRCPPCEEPETSQPSIVKCCKVARRCTKGKKKKKKKKKKK